MLCLLFAQSCQTRSLNEQSSKVGSIEAFKSALYSFSQTPIFIFAGALFGAFAPIVLLDSTGSQFEYKYQKPPEQLAAPATMKSIALATDDFKESLEELGVVAHNSGIVQIVTRKGYVIQSFDPFNLLLPLNGNDDHAVVDESQSRISSNRMSATVKFISKRTRKMLFSRCRETRKGLFHKPFREFFSSGACLTSEVG